jgi:cysteinyl-tRNA synthetase
MEQLHLYNSLTRQKEKFEPINPPFVGLYVCGPTVYGDAHLGHARPAITFDVLFRYLKHLGYKVRYVRNITDVGHLENDADEGEDKILKKARLEQLEPMEVAQYFADRYHDDMRLLNTLNPSIEPRATGHIPEQIKMIEKLIENGYAYEVNGSVYFDVHKYSQSFYYGELSGRTDFEEMLSGSRTLDGQTEKRHATDFALWKKAAPAHIMRWNSPWGEGFPGWHIECSAMSTKYLGEIFDIHGGGMDLKFPHHEAEIAQTNACYLHTDKKKNQARVWMHCNMLTINGQKMSKSIGNFITLEQFFSGNHEALERAFSPMTIRFFILQSHYRSTVDFSNDALIAAEKGLRRLLYGISLLENVKTSTQTTIDLSKLKDNLYQSLNDDLNTAICIAHLFEAVRLIYAIDQNEEKITPEDLVTLKELLHTFVFEVLGLIDETNIRSEQFDSVMQILIDLRQQARNEKNFALSDQIRNQLQERHIVLRDTPDGTKWTFGE